MIFGCCNVRLMVNVVAMNCGGVMVRVRHMMVLGLADVRDGMHRLGEEEGCAQEEGNQGARHAEPTKRPHA